MSELMDMESTREGLKYLANTLAYGDAKLFEGKMYVAPYFKHVERFTKEHCRMVFTKIASEANVMPTPIELATFFGVPANPDVTLTTSIKSELLRAAAGEDNMLSKKAKAFLKFEGLTVWDISRNESSRMKISRKNIEGFIEAVKLDPNLEKSLLHNPNADLVKRIPTPDKKERPVLDQHRKIPTTRNLVKELASVVSVK